MEIYTKDAIQSITRSELSFFTYKTFSTVAPGIEYLHNWHIDLITDYLIACKNGDIDRLIINIPPRLLKSISVAVAFPAWLLGHNPSEQIMCASYSKELAHKHSLDCRLVVESQWYQEIFPQTQLVSDQNTKTKFVTTRRGFRIATSVGGTATGEGGNFLIVDDPVSAQQADSTLYRQTANIWFDRTFYTRLNDKKKGCIIIIMQRFHEDDLTGHLLKKGGWEHLKIPMIAEQDEHFAINGNQYERKEGEYLHFNRMGPEEVRREKEALGPYGFAGQHQQSPVPTGGGKFRREWIKYYKNVYPEDFNCYMLVDPAYTKSKDSDYTAIWIIGAAQDGNLYVLDLVRDRLGAFEKEEMVFNLHRKYKNLQVYYETGGVQRDSDWLKLAMEQRNYRFTIHDVKCPPKLSKEDRISRLRKYFIDGRIYLPQYLFKTNSEGKLVDVIEEFIEQEYLQFDAASHDDMLDALSRICDINILYPGQNNIDYYQIYR
jgi:predicted phage terminase large subunit-like protein